MEITAKTQKVGLLGWPIGHSLSPAMHNAAFEDNGLDFVYLPMAVEPGQLANAMVGLRALGFKGVNVTIPHKITIMNYLDEIDISAKLVGAVNTVVFKDGKAIGYNTDAEGYIHALLAAEVSVTGKCAVILGAGGAARAVVAGFINNEAKSIVVAAREITKAQKLITAFGDKSPITSCAVGDKVFIEAVAAGDIIVNTTPVGMYPNQYEKPSLDWSMLKPDCVISDLVYNPLTTQFMAEADRRGHKVVGGAGMLVEQGALAFKLWTGYEPSRALMHQALIKSVNR